MSDYEPSTPAKRALIQNQIAGWTNSLYDASVSARVAVALKDEVMKKAATEQSEKAIRALDELKKILAEVENPVEPAPSG